MNDFINMFFNIELITKVLPDLVGVGLMNTLILAVSATAIALAFGIVIAMALISRHRWLNWPARIYVDLLRGLPVILTIFLIGQGLPYMGVQPFGPSAYPYGIISLGLIGAAYMAEIFRSGIQSIHHGQLEAARALGMPYTTSMAMIVVPQGIRNVFPALTNQFIGIVKDTSLVYVLGLAVGERELYRIGQDMSQRVGNLSPLVAAGIVYLIITVPLTYYVNWLDNRLRTGRVPVIVEEPATKAIASEGAKA
ncbi:His/Glu/Gln/Arg/opine family amino acid ABC transporter permease subunit [Okibacterium sp. HSC-33S16]|uniref:amino acid ABC transporter permease n=1 Tax=Okibacterium sp. HSC-33S16 TaxID=2910965 RepID=UPI0020A09C35|nr:amino acid ABC transporter permease [Okibacterium sp. HSC-33S16]MCP2032128.1 His/Glu/Gln/Arg/opine family amino acid ABC transporter permease subunit [Okibacterium sp. HSC-33S16]